jgi:hypothetical protein
VPLLLWSFHWLIHCPLVAVVVAPWLYKGTSRK